MTRSRIFKIAVIAGLCFLLGFSYNYHLPRFESFLLVEIERLSQEHSPVRVWAQRLKFHLLPLGIVLEDVKILAQPPLDQYLAPATLRQVGVRLALWPLVRGEVRFSQIYLSDSELNIFLKNDLFATPKHAPKVRLDFDQLYRLPIDEISLENVQIQGRLDPQNVVFRISDLSLLVENRFQSLFVEVSTPRLLVKPSGPSKPIAAQIELRSLVEAQEIQISALKLKANDSFIVASGRFTGDFAAGLLENGEWDARSKMHLADINLWESVFFLKPSVPHLEGQLEFDMNAKVSKTEGYKLDGQLNTRDVVIDKFVVGQLQGHVQSNMKTVSSDAISIENSAGRMELSKVQLTLEPNPHISLNLKVPKLEVHQLLENLAVKHVPVLVPVKGEASCQGEWQQEPEITCQIKLATGKIHVDSGRPKFSTIVELGDSMASGSARVTAHQVEYKADVTSGQSSGHSDGVINYDTGFKINYVGDKVDFADVKNLVNLKLQGLVKVSGNTIGTSDWATIDLNAEGKDLWLEDYPLGVVSSKMNYKAGKLHFTGIEGVYNVSRYQGSVDLDLDKNRIKISGQVPFTDLKDIQALVQRKIVLPASVSGTGTAKVEADGPFRFQDLNYDFRSSFYRGQIAGEAFDDLVFHVRSVNGLVKSEKIMLTKSSGVVDVKGQITPTGEIDTVAVGHGLRLEQSENISAMGLDLQGLADFTVLVRGQLPHPRIELNGRLSKVVLGDRATEDSVFKLSFLSDRMEGSGQFLGTTLLTDFTFPYEKAAPFLFKLKTKKWDFTTLFSLISRSARQIDLNTSVSMDMRLQAPQGGFWASTGQVRLNEFVIRKGTKVMSAEKPMTLNFKQGVVNSQDFALTSGESYLKLDVAGLSRTNLNASLNGKMDLSLLAVFTPFISDLRGNMALSMDLKGNVEKPYLSGSAYIDRGYAKFNDLYHPFANIRADVLFNDNQVMVNTLRADLAGGKVSGEGKITFSGKSRPVDVKGTFSDVKLNVPDGFHTQGSGNVAIRGDRFPYQMDINYEVTGGEIVYEVGQKTDGIATVKASPFLPRTLDLDIFHPFNFGLDVNFKNPIVINNHFLQASATGRVKVNGTPDRLLLNGSFTPIQGGKAFFNDAPFEISSGYVEYNNTPPDDPKIYLTANARVTDTVADESGRSTQNQYDVSLLVQGHGQAPQITLASQPPLGQRELISLLALGTTGAPQGEERKTSETQSANPSAALGGALLQKAGGKRVKETFGVDLKVSSSQATTENASSPKVTLSKQWTPKLGASASTTIEANPNNNVKLEYKMDKNVSVIGSWDGREALRDQTKDTTRNVLGLDLQYKMQFK